VKRYLIYDLQHNHTIMTEDLHTKQFARQARRELAKHTGQHKRFIVIPGPDHKKWTSPSSRTGR
jgi:hypothetical protein